MRGCERGALVRGVDPLNIIYGLDNPCTESADDRAHRLMPHRTPCTYSADDRARRLNPHRTPCT